MILHTKKNKNSLFLIKFQFHMSILNIWQQCNIVFDQHQKEAKM